MNPLRAEATQLSELATAPPRELIRIATAGSVDDGKSTLVGRLLHDSKSVFVDQLTAIAAASKARGEARPNLALVTDGLRAERAQDITIDVAHRYFSTPTRKFIIADTPGHEQYTRNMVTGASTADVAIILVDAREGPTQQTRRHALITSLLGVEHVVLCINKMDLVDWSSQRFHEIQAEFQEFATKLEKNNVTAIPASALLGDNIVVPSANMSWYEGPSLLSHLEQVHISCDCNLTDARFPVQCVIRPEEDAATRSMAKVAELRDFRAVAGTVASGVFQPGDEIVALPSGSTSTVAAIWGPGGAVVDKAFAGSAVSLQLADELDIDRGDLLCRPNNRPLMDSQIDAMVCWLTDASTLAAGSRFEFRHVNSTLDASIAELDYRLDVNTLHRDHKAKELKVNEIGRVQLHLQRPITFDPYRRNRTTGSFILVDEFTNDTVAAGMISGPSLAQSQVVWHSSALSPEQRLDKGGTIWITGLSASGKSTVAVELERLLFAMGIRAYRLDGDNLRHGLNADLGFSAEDRAENVRRVGAVAQLLADSGMVAIAALISPYRADREKVRSMHDATGLPFVEVFVDTPVSLCEQRDPKGMYAKARAGEISEFTGVNSPYEAPSNAELVLRPHDGNPEQQAAAILDYWLAL